ncbi:MAG: hypothetical protein QM601_06645, partial [Pseudoxanthomonas sp.]
MRRRGLGFGFGGLRGCSGGGGHDRHGGRFGRAGIRRCRHIAGRLARLRLGGFRRGCGSGQRRGTGGRRFRL